MNGCANPPASAPSCSTATRRPSAANASTVASADAGSVTDTRTSPRPGFAESGRRAYPPAAPPSPAVVPTTLMRKPMKAWLAHWYHSRSGAFAGTANVTVADPGRRRAGDAAVYGALPPPAASVVR